MRKSLKIGLALGGGAARGWAHIGVINRLQQAGIIPDIVVGTSIGALVGAAYASDKLAQLQQRLLTLTKLETARFFTLSFPFRGMIHKEKLQHFLAQYVADEDRLVESLTMRYASVATDLHTGHEVWVTDGSLLEAVWASIALPGLFPAIKHTDRWLIDGGLVNPVPVSVCRALGADIVIAVNLNGDILGKHFQRQPVPAKQEQGSNFLAERINGFISNYTGTLFAEDTVPKEDVPNMFDAIAAAVNITQDRITRSRMAGDPPDIVLQPRLAHIGLLEFFRAAEAIEAGSQSVDKSMADIEFCLRRNQQ